MCTVVKYMRILILLTSLLYTASPEPTLQPPVLYCDDTLSGGRRVDIKWMVSWRVYIGPILTLQNQRHCTCMHCLSNKTSIKYIHVYMLCAMCGFCCANPGSPLCATNPTIVIYTLRTDFACAYAHCDARRPVLGLA